MLWMLLGKFESAICRSSLPGGFGMLSGPARRRVGIQPLNGSPCLRSSLHATQARDLDPAGQLATRSIALGIPPQASYAHQNLTKFNEEMEWENGRRLRNRLCSQGTFS